MQNATLLVILGKTAAPDTLADLSQTAQAKNLHLSVLILGELPPVPVQSYGIGEYGAFALPEGWQDGVDATHAELKAKQKELSQYLADQGVSADVHAVVGVAAALPDAAARAALTRDAVVIGDDLRDSPRLFGDVVQEVLFRAPSRLLLNALAHPRALQPTRVFVAWKAGMQAARAVQGAMPLLRGADEVTVALFDPVATRQRDGENPGSDVAAWLTHQGCPVTVQQFPSGGADIGEAIIERAVEGSADLIVMGAYGHWRLRETVFGGTTRTLTEQRDIPVFLSH